MNLLKSKKNIPLKYSNSNNLYFTVFFDFSIEKHKILKIVMKEYLQNK